MTRPEVHLERELSHDVEPGSQLFPTPLAVVYWRTLPKELSQGQVQGQIPGSQNSFCGFTVGLESRHPVLPP